MNFREHDDGQLTKEKDVIERYLLRIVHRYFDIENNYTKESIEAIIIESISRLKHFMGTHFNFIISLNGKTGIATLSLKDIKGEPAFDKNNAFNKDFGNVADTICEGNDPRLSDAREPFPHIHNIMNINEINAIMQQCDTMKNVHSHANHSILDLITYAGAKAKIDLIILDQLQIAATEATSEITYRHNEFDDMYTEKLDTLIEYTDKLNHEINNTRNLIMSGINWLDVAYSYANTNIKQYSTQIKKFLNQHVTKESVNKIEEILKNIPHIIIEGESELSNSNSFTIHQFNVPKNPDDKIKMFLRYETNGSTVTSPLPFNFDDGEGGTLVVQAGFADNGDVVAKYKMTNIASYFSNPRIYYQVVG